MIKLKKGTEISQTLSAVMKGIKNMKKKVYKFVSFAVAAVMLCFFSSCANTSGGSGKLKIVTTLFPQYDFARQITGGNADVTLLLTPGAESHTYEPTPKDILKIQNADMFIYVGGESEVWVDNVLESANNKSMKKIRLMDNIQPIEEENSEGNEPEYDEHIFTSLKNSLAVIEEMCSAICEADTQNADAYKKNAKDYSDKIKALDNKFTELTENAKRKTVVFGDRFPFAYFARDYKLDCSAAFSGCSSETEASSATLSQLISIVKEENIPTVFYIEFSSQTIANKIADAAGVKTALLHSCHNISKEDIENNVSYADLMEGNYRELSEALN